MSVETVEVLEDWPKRVRQDLTIDTIKSVYQKYFAERIEKDIV